MAASEHGLPSRFGLPSVRHGSESRPTVVVSLAASVLAERVDSSARRAALRSATSTTTPFARASTSWAASALIKLIFDERGSELAVELWDRADILVSSQLLYPEARAALAAAARGGRFAESTQVSAVATLEDLYAQLRTVAHVGQRPQRRRTRDRPVDRQRHRLSQALSANRAPTSPARATGS